MKKLTIVLGAAVSLALAAPALAQAQTVIKFSHVVAPDTPKGKAPRSSRSWPRSTPTARSRSRSIRTQLYKDKEELEALQLGAVQILAPSLAKFGPLGVKEFEVFDLPSSSPTRRRSARSPRAARQADAGEARAQGHHGLAYWDNGFKVMSANKTLRMPADFRGLKMRIQSSKVLEAQMRVLGAIPQVMAFSEVYQALQTGVVDGTENPPSNKYTQKMHEVQKYTTRLRPRLRRLRGHHQQEVLGRAAGGHPRAAGKGDGRGDRIRQRRRAAGERRGGRGDEEIGQDRDRRADRRAEGGVAQGAGAGLQRHGKPRRQGNARPSLQGSRLRPARTDRRGR